MPQLISAQSAAGYVCNTAELNGKDEPSTKAQPLVVGVSLALVAGASIVSYLGVHMGGVRTAIVCLAAVGAAALPTSRTSPRAGRIGMAFVALVVLHFFDPVGSAYARGAARRLHSSNDLVRTDEIGRRVGRGSPDLAAGDVRGFSFAGRDLTRANFAGASAQRVDFSGANLCDANLERADVTGAKLERANLSLVNLSTAIGVADATCDAATLMPAHWTCTQGHPALDSVGSALLKTRIVDAADVSVGTHTSAVLSN